MVQTISGTASDLAAAFDGITSHTGGLTITGTTPATVAELMTINAATSVPVVLNAATIAANLSDTAANLAAAFDSITTSTSTLTITGTTPATVAELMTINAATSGTVVLNNATISGTNVAAFTDTASNLAAAFDGITSSTSTLAISGTTPATVAELMTINAASNGNVVLNSETIAQNYNDTATNLAAAFDDITTSTSMLTITGAGTATIAELKAINAATSGAVVLNSETNASAYTDTAANLISAFTGITSHTGGLTVSDTGSISAADLNMINTFKASGLTTATATSVITGSASEILTALDEYHLYQQFGADHRRTLTPATIDRAQSDKRRDKWCRPSERRD